MTNGMQLQADDAIGGTPPADAPGPTDVAQSDGPVPTGPVPIGPGPTGTGPIGTGLIGTGLIGTGLIGTGPRSIVPARRRSSLAVIPRRATGIHTAIPVLDAPVTDLSTDPHGGVAHAGPAPGSVTRRRRVGLLGAAAALLTAAVAVPVWLDGHRPAPPAQQVTPVGAGLPGGPADAGALAVDDPSVAPPTRTTGPGAGLPTVTRPTDAADSAPGTALPTATAPTGIAPTTAPAGAVTTPAQRPEDAATQEPPDQGETDPPVQDPPVQDPPQDQPTFAARGNPTGRNLALGRQAFASSFANRLRGPEQAVDGKLLSKWSTRATDEQWIAVDLGDTFRISRVRIAWELAFADTYRVDLSTDGRSWTSVWQTRSGLGGTVGIPMDADATARYVRVYGVEPAGRLGYAIRELDVR